MSIRKVSDLPEIEPSEVSGSARIVKEEDLSCSLLEISLLSSNQDKSQNTYASRCVKFGTLRDLTVDRVHERISSEYQIKVATESELGGVRLGYRGDSDNDGKYPISSDSNGNLFVKYPVVPFVKKVDGIEPTDGQVTLNSISNVVGDGHYITTSSGGIQRRDISVSFTPHSIPDFSTISDITSTDDFKNGISSSTDGLFVYANISSSQNSNQISCYLSYTKGDELLWRPIMQIPMQNRQTFGLNFSTEMKQALKIESDKAGTTITGYKCKRK